MTVKVKIKNLDVINRIAGQIKKDVSQNLMKTLMADIMLEVVRLANTGRNSNNEQLLPYSKWYVTKRLKEGLRVTPNFQYSSSMINSLSVYTSKDKWSIGVSGADADGVSNAFKLAKVEKIKNYQLLFWTNYLERLIDKHINRYKKQRGKS